MFRDGSAAFRDVRISSSSAKGQSFSNGSNGSLGVGAGILPVPRQTVVARLAMRNLYILKFLLRIVEASYF